MRTSASSRSHGVCTLCLDRDFLPEADLPCSLELQGDFQETGDSLRTVVHPSDRSFLMLFFCPRARGKTQSLLSRRHQHWI